MTTRHRTQTQTSLRTLTAYDAWSLLEAAEIARVGWLGPDGVAVAPVNYSVAEGAIWFRTDPESALGQECEGQRVVVEVDQIDVEARSGWSVVVIGIAELVDSTQVPDSVDVRVWPAGSHSMFVRVASTDVSGKRLFGLSGESG